MRALRFLLSTLAGTVLLAAPAFAQVSAGNANKIGGLLTGAYLTASHLERELGTSQGVALDSAVVNGLTSLEKVAADCEALAGGSEYLQPGLKHLRDVAGRIKLGGKTGKAAAGLAGEASIEIFALLVNAAILEAEDHLKSAAASLKDSKAVIAHLQEAERALNSAMERGAYHVDNDLEAVREAIDSMTNALSENKPVNKDDIETRIEEIHGHLFDVGNE